MFTRPDACMKYLQIPLVILATLSTSIALADDFKTISGKEYKNATVSRVAASVITCSVGGDGWKRA